MTTFSPKNWFRANIGPYLSVIKAWVTSLVSTEVAAAEARITAELGSITGTFKGTGATFATLPSGGKVGDWSVLTADDVGNSTPESPQYESGIYVKAAGGWNYVCDITSLDEMQTILATDAEFAQGIPPSTKAATAQQVRIELDTLSTAITGGLAAKANLAGSTDQTFSVADAQDGMPHAVAASQFATGVTQAEAEADWAAA